MRSPAASGFDVGASSVTGVLGGTVTFCEPPANCTTMVELPPPETLPFVMRDAGDEPAVPLVMRDADTAPFVMRLPPPPAPEEFPDIIRLPSPSPRSASGKM